MKSVKPQPGYFTATRMSASAWPADGKRASPSPCAQVAGDAKSQHLVGRSGSPRSRSPRPCPWRPFTTGALAARSLGDGEAVGGGTADRCSAAGRSESICAEVSAGVTARSGAPTRGTGTTAQDQPAFRARPQPSRTWSTWPSAIIAATLLEGAEACCPAGREANARTEG